MARCPPQQTWPNATQDFLSFNSDGYSVGVKYTGSWNSSGDDYVSWTFRKAKKFFDVGTWTGDGTTPFTLPHKLGSIVGTSIVKCTSHPADWTVNHVDLPDHYLVLNKTDKQESDVKMVSTDSTITFTGSDPYYNFAGREYVAYLFAHDDSDESMIKCGSYTGNGSSQSIDLGFEPQWLLIKNATSSFDTAWQLFDNMRGIGDASNNSFVLYPNDSKAEGASNTISISSTGFNLVDSSGTTNANGAKHIYIAIRRPNKPADEFEADDVFAVAYSQDQEPDPSFVSGFPVDLGMYTRPVATYSNILIPRLTDKMLFSEASADESNASAGFDYMNGYISQDWQVHNPTLLSWMWRRAPGFFDVVAYTGDGSEGRSVPHNLGAFPELIIAKVRSRDGAWFVRHNDTAGGLLLNTNEQAQPYYWIDTDTPTDEFFKVSRNYAANMPDEQYIAYLFASVPGISKVGSYTGNGGNGEVRYIDCGFDPSGQSTKGLLVKRVDSAGDWAWHYPASNGVECGMRLHLNDTSVGVRQYDLGAGFGGFQLQPTSPYNIDGAEYIYYAIAL